MSWLDNIQASQYKTHDAFADPCGMAATYRQILLCPSHELLTLLIELRNLDHSDPAYKTKKLAIKAMLPCYTPAAWLANRRKGLVEVIKRTGLLQLDFDYADILEYDIRELMQCVFSLPFVCFCGLSCSGDGFYALVMIAEPDRLAEYAEHLFAILLEYGIKADTSKGKKVENLRYMSYDSKMLIRENPEPLRIKHFKTLTAPKKPATLNHSIYTGNDGIVRASLTRIKDAKTGQRWQTVQQVAYTLGGLGDNSLIHAIKSEIESNPEFNGEELKYCKCADDCFVAGMQKPLNQFNAIR